MHVTATSVCVCHLHDMSIDLEGLLKKQTVLETQDLPCMCPAHHEPASLESVVMPCPVFMHLYHVHACCRCEEVPGVDSDLLWQDP